MSKKYQLDHIDKFFEYDIDIPNRTIYMGSDTHDEEGEGGVDYLLTKRVIKSLHIFRNSGNEPITIIMNNIGGDTIHGCAIYDAIRACTEQHVTIKVYGYAMSAGSFILQAADTRIMSPSSSMMIHYGAINISDNMVVAKKWMQEADRLDKWLEDVYIKKIKEKKPTFNMAHLRKWLSADTYFTAKEAVANGLADSVEFIE